MARESDAIPLERMAAHLLEKVSHHVLYLDHNGHIMYANPSACARLGYSVDNILHKTLFDLSPETSTAAWTYDWEQLIDGKESILHRYYQDQEGNDFPVEVFAVPYTPEGQAAYLCKMVTEQANTQAYRRLLEMLEDHIGIGGIEWTLHSGHIVATKGALTLLGTRSPRDISPDRLTERVDTAYRAQWQEGLNSLVAHGQGLNCRLPLHTYDGQYKWINIVLRTVASPKNGTDKIEGIYRAVQPALAEEDAIAIALLRESTDLILLVGPDGEVVFSSPSLEDMLGYQVAGLSIFELEYDLTQEQWQARWQQLRKEPRRLEVQACRTNGTLINAELTYRAFQWQEQEYMYYQLRNIDRFKQREAALRTAISAYQQTLPALPADTAAAGNGQQGFISLDDAQRIHIVRALMRTNWRVSGENGAARLLSINAKTLFARMKKLGIRREDY